MEILLASHLICKEFLAAAFLHSWEIGDRPAADKSLIAISKSAHLHRTLMQCTGTQQLAKLAVVTQLYLMEQGVLVLVLHRNAVFSGYFLQFLGN